MAPPELETVTPSWIPSKSSMILLSLYERFRSVDHVNFVAEVLEPAGRQFEALVLDVARIDELRFVTALPRQRHLEVLVLGVGLVIGGVYVQTVLEELSVETDLERVGLFGFKIAACGCRKVGICKCGGSVINTSIP